jgi:hypothetical protein
MMIQRYGNVWIVLENWLCEKAITVARHSIELDQDYGKP